MWQKLFETDFDRTMTFLRCFLGVVLFPHGAQKLLGWYGGAGFDRTMSSFSERMHVPALFVLLMIATEFLGSIALIIGAMGRLAAFAFVVEMMTAVYLVHLPNGFFMNWNGRQAGEGF